MIYLGTDRCDWQYFIDGNKYLVSMDYEHCMEIDKEDVPIDLLINEGKGLKRKRR